MLTRRFRSIQDHLGHALQALVERGRIASRVVAALGALVLARTLRLEALMQRFEKGMLRPRAAYTRKTAGRAGAGVVVPERLWPEHLPNWLFLVGFNNPSPDVRARWIGWHGGTPPQSRHLVEYARQFRALVEGDAPMRGLLGISREARRLGRWFLRMGDAGATPEILKEPRRKRARRVRVVEARPRRPRRRREPWESDEPPKPKRPPGPFEGPPGNLNREEREARGMPVPPVHYIHDPMADGFIPTHIQLEGRRRSGW